MQEQTFTITESELETVLYEELQKQRHILFDLCREDYFLLPNIQETKHKRNISIFILKTEWERHLGRIFQLFDDLSFAREALQAMEPVYRKYKELYEKEHDFCFDEYIKKTVVSYDAEEFERLRDRFEEEHYKELDDDIER